MMPYQEALEIIKTKYDYEKIVDDKNDTSKGYRVPGHKGKFGFITSMSDHFCGSCNRLRMTADGNLKVCLFDSKEFNLKELLRANASDEEIYKIIGGAVQGKKEAHGDMHDLAATKNRPMITIGG